MRPVGRRGGAVLLAHVVAGCELSGTPGGCVGVDAFASFRHNKFCSIRRRVSAEL